MLRNLCVFCGSSWGASPVYAEIAERTGRLLAGRGVGLIFGGSKLGLMGAMADACLASGGHVTGVIPQALVDKEHAHRGITELHVVKSMHERKAVMADLADAFMALPGGFGTWEEFFEVLTWSQLGLQRKACGLLNVNGYYDCVLGMADRAVEEGFLKAVHRELLVSDSDPERLIEKISAQAVPIADKWINRGGC